MKLKKLLTEEKTKIRLVIFSYLSDAQATANISTRENLNFVKFLLMKYNLGNNMVNIDADWREFQEKHGKM